MSGDKIKRYNVDDCQQTYCCAPASVCEDSDGDWVRYDDHVAVVAALTAELDEAEYHSNLAGNLADQLQAARREVELLREALTPSAETKAAYMGEFVFRLPYDPFDGGEVAVPWATVKDIMAAIRARAALRGEVQP